MFCPAETLGYIGSSLEGKAVLAERTTVVRECLSRLGQLLQVENCVEWQVVTPGATWPLSKLVAGFPGGAIQDWCGSVPIFRLTNHLLQPYRLIEVTKCNITS